MKRYENDCCDCTAAGYPCIGSSCPRRKVPHYYCDECDEEIRPLYTYDGREYCAECLIAELVEQEVIDEVDV